MPMCNVKNFHSNARGFIYTTRKWIFRERVHFSWEWKTHSHENDHFHESDVNPRRENIFSWECSTHRHENQLFMKVNSHEINKLSRNPFVKVNSHEIPNSHELHSWQWTLTKYKKNRHENMVMRVLHTPSWKLAIHEGELSRNPFVKVNSHEILNSHEIYSWRWTLTKYQKTVMKILMQTWLLFSTKIIVQILEIEEHAWTNVFSF
jgi:hypothetical protein